MNLERARQKEKQKRVAEAKKRGIKSLRKKRGSGENSQEGSNKKCSNNNNNYASAFIDAQVEPDGRNRTFNAKVQQRHNAV